MEQPTLQLHLARGLSDKVAIESLLALNKLEVNEALAVNRNLSEEQVTRLLETSNILEKVKITPTTELAVLLASRYDLTPTQMWAIVRGRNVLARQALLSRFPPAGASRGVIDSELFAYILSAKWYSEDYGQDMRHSAFSFDRGSIWRLPDYDANLAGRRLPYSKNPSEPSNRAYAVREKRIWQILAESGFDLYRKELPTQKNTLFVDTMLARSLSSLSIAMSYIAVVPAEIITLRVQQLIGSVGTSFYDLLFQVLPGWEGSMPELICATKTLTTEMVIAN